MEFKKYQHIERLGNIEVEGIEIGECYIFPKIDGTNSSVWLKDGEIRCGSRNRELTLENDNAGFYAEMLKHEEIKKFLTKYPQYRLFGEWLVPHTLKTYREDAWRKFYIFDVAIDNPTADGGLEYIPYSNYVPLLTEFNIEYIAPLKIIKNPTEAMLLHVVENNMYLIKDGEGVGEGIIIKNYNYYNKYGRQKWAKIVRNEFKENHHKSMGAPQSEGCPIEEKIINELLTDSFIEKEYNKIVNNNAGWESKYIPQLLNTIFYEFICDEIWNICKKYKMPKINFKTLQVFCFKRIKEVKKELF